MKNATLPEADVDTERRERGVREGDAQTFGELDEPHPESGRETAESRAMREFEASGSPTERISEEQAMREFESPDEPSQRPPPEDGHRNRG